MIDPKQLEELTRRIQGLLPPGVDRLRDEFHDNLREILSSTLARMDVVTREEFEVQSAVLERTREKLTKLEALVAELEEKNP